MKVLVTGAGGFIGRQLITFLERQGVATVPLPRQADLANASALVPFIKDARPDYVFHLAGVMQATTPVESYQVNTVFAAALLQALAEAGFAQTPVMLTGSGAELGKVDIRDLPITEDTVARPFNHYGASKLAQTHLGLAVARTESRPVVVARPFNVIGPGMPSNLAVQAFAEQLAGFRKNGTTGPLRTGTLTSQRDFVDVADAVRYLWALIREPKAYGKLINVCSGRPVAMQTIVDKLLALAGGGIRHEFDPARIRADDVPVHYGSNELLASLVGPLDFTPLDDTLATIFSAECARAGL